MSSSNPTSKVEEIASVKDQAVAADQHAVAPPEGGEAEDTKTPTHFSRGRNIVGILFAVALMSAIVWGLHIRAVNEASVARATQAAAVLTVNVMHPVEGSKADDLALPGNVEAFTDTPIYSRTILDPSDSLASGMEVHPRIVRVGGQP